MVQVWKSVVGFPNYAVSDHGQVKRLTTRNSARADSLLSQFLVCGYPSVNLLGPGGRKSCRVHRLVAEAFLLKPDGASEVNHIDADRANNQLQNLEWVTSSGNRFHAYRVGGLRADGEHNGFSKLTQAAVDELRLEAPRGRAARQIAAERLGVSIATINDVLAGRTWPTERLAAFK